MGRGGGGWRHVVSATSAICGVKPEHSRLKPYGNPRRICLSDIHIKIIKIIKKLEIIRPNICGP
jgi:hypothetical protein